MLRGAVAAALTPLRDGGESVDEGAIERYVEFLAGGGLDGVLALGTTGEGILLSQLERRRVAEAYVKARTGRLAVAVNCGAQTTADTVALAAHAAEVGADSVAVIGPPYFALDEDALFAHFAAAARACAPLPFYVYEFRARVGYSIPLPLLERLRGDASNLVGLKVSNRPFDALAPYLLEGLEVFVGAEELALRALEAGAAGVVSGLAAAYPETVVALVRERSPALGREVAELRGRLERLPFHAALKHVVHRRGVLPHVDVRRPLRVLADEEREELDTWLESSLQAPAR